MTPEGERRKQQFMALIGQREQMPDGFNMRPGAAQFRADNGLPPAPAVDSPRSLPPRPPKRPWYASPEDVVEPSEEDRRTVLAESGVIKPGGSGPMTPEESKAIIMNYYAKNGGGGVAQAQEAAGPLPSGNPDLHQDDGGFFLGTPGEEPAAEDPKAKFLQALSSQRSGKLEERRGLQNRQSFDENMQLPPNLISAWSPQGMHFLESSPGGPPSQTRQKQIDEINQSERDTKKNAAEIEASRVRSEAAVEAARVKEESAAQERRPMVSTDISEISDLETAAADLEDIEKGLADHEGDVGPWDAKWGKVKEFFGAGAKGAAYRAGVMDFMIKFRKATSGVSFGKQEAKDIQTAIIHPDDTEEIIAAKIPRLKKALARAREIKLANLERAGKDVSQFPRGSPVDGGTSPGGGGKRMAVGPNGERGKLPEDTDLAEYSGWKWE